MRIGFTGSAGTGKTTTMMELNKSLKYPLVHEGVRDYLSDNNIEHLRDMNPDDVLKMQLWLIDQKEKNELGHSDSLSDRISIDNFVYALEWLSRSDIPDIDNILLHYFKRCMKHAMSSYDLICVFPYGVFPIEDDGVRSVKSMYQFKIQMLIERAIGQLVDVPVYMVQSISVKDRVTEIKGAMEQVLQMEQKDSEGVTVQ